MVRTRLLQAVCTVAMLAAVPALAQNSDTNTGMSGAPGAGTPPAPTGGNSNMAPADNAGSMGEGHAAHRSKMGHGSMHSSKGANAQDAEVDRLNEQSYQAAQRGQAFSATGSSGGSGAMMAPNGAGKGSGAPMMPMSNPPGAMNGYGTPGSNATVNSTGASQTGSGANEPSPK
jgi:hypothetical protein